MSLDPKDQPPAMLWDVKAWLNSESVSAMTWPEQGVYMHLLARGWMNVGIPSKVGLLGRMVRMSAKEFAGLWELIGPNWIQPTDRMLEIWEEIEAAWQPPDDRLWNPRQEEARLLAWRGVRDKERRSAAASAAASARWNHERQAA